MEIEPIDIEQTNDSSDSDRSDILPSITNRTYSTYKRPRRDTKKIPQKYWNSMIRCVEYPDGVFINKYGATEVLQYCSEDELSDEEFEKLNPIKKRKIIQQLKEQQDFEELEEKEDLEYDQLTKNENYDVDDLIVDEDFASHMKGDEEYLPSSTEDSEYFETDHEIYEDSDDVEDNENVENGGDTSDSSSDVDNESDVEDKNQEYI
jgi:hypothetical protein